MARPAAARTPRATAANRPTRPAMPARIGAVARGWRGARPGTALFILLTVVALLYITGTMFLSYMTQEKTQSARQSETMVATYLAEAGVEKALVKFRQMVSEPLLDKENRINNRLLALLDFDQADNFSMTVEIADGELIKNGRAKVVLDVRNLRQTPFKAYIDEYVDVPSPLLQYRKKSRDTYTDKALGGWEGHLRVTSEGTYKLASKKIEVTRDLKVSDLTPPAENYTLFIAGKNDEWLKEGEFKLRNWNLVRSLNEMIEALIKVINDAVLNNLGKSAESLFWESKSVSMISFEGDFKMKVLKVIQKLVMGTSDVKLKDYVDTTIQELHPYLWGKVRTNGRLHVYLPFFAADDIINYFEDNSIFSHQRPEIGYLFCSNQLHDPYLSKYTYYEGEIIKYFQKLKPYVLGITETPYPSSDPYTINTKFDFVSRYPEKLNPMQRERIVKYTKDFCHEVVEGDLKLEGTYQKPIELWGIIYVRGQTWIGGRVTGSGMIVCDNDIHVTQSLTHDSASVFLSLVSLKGSVRLAKGSNIRIESAIYAENSLVGGDSVSILGNLVVENLNRQKGERGEVLMPKRVNINYDSDLKSHVGDNICFNLSEALACYRDLGI